MTIPDMLLRLLSLLSLSQLCLAVIDNRKPDANYVIPISKDQSAEVYCVSYFAKTIIQEVMGPKPNVTKLNCQKCELSHVRYRCCRIIRWEDIAEPLTLRCTSVKPEWDKADKNIPRIDVSVVRKSSKKEGNEFAGTEDSAMITAESSTVYYCHNRSDVTELTAGSHIGLGWKSQSINYNPALPTDATPESSYTERAKQYDQVIDMNDNARNKEAQFRQLYKHEKFENLWISEDKKVELMAHKTKFECNETEYYLEKGSQCLTPSKRAVFIMTNCSLVAQIFIVIGVIALLVLSYIVFNLLVWLWNYVMHKSRRNDDDMAILM